LLRFYGFDLNDLPFDPGGNLPLNSDPKLIWAQQHLRQPVEINRASRSELLRVPGIGPKTADEIVNIRRQGRITDLHQLKQMGVWTSRAAPYVILNGRQPGYQLRLAGI
jgi:predicted DNA-binding helix-hairpin-helix protein